MASKFLLSTLRPLRLIKKNVLKQKKTLFPQAMTVRCYGHFIPPSQYDIPLTSKFNIFHVMVYNWETIPLFFTMALGIGFPAAYGAYCCSHKVDVVFHTHSRNNISRTMDLRNPEIHKIVTINQKYEPWPEMQAVLEKMKNEHFKRLENKKFGKC